VEFYSVEYQQIGMNKRLARQIPTGTKKREENSSQFAGTVFLIEDFLNL